MLSNIKDRLLSTQLKKDERTVSVLFFIGGLIIIILFANVVYLNIALWKKPSPTNQDHISPTSNALPTQCLNCTTPTAIPTNQIIYKQTQSIQTSGVKEYFIPIGTGTNQSSDWQDVLGAVATVDLGSYGNVNSIYFEASVNVPTGNQVVSLRLFNKTDQHPVWNSEVSTNGGNGGALTSSAIIYDTGQKTYQVQAKTQLSYLANIVQSRLHIKLN